MSGWARDGRGLQQTVTVVYNEFRKRGKNMTHNKQPEIPCPADCDDGRMEYISGGEFDSRAGQWYPREKVGPCDRCGGRGTIWPAELTEVERLHLLEAAEDE